MNPIGTAFPAIASETRGCLDVQDARVWSRPKYRAVPVQSGQQEFPRWKQKPINTSATSTPKSVKHQENKGRDDSSPVRSILKKFNTDHSRPGVQAMRVDLIEIDHAMGVFTQGWRSMPGKSMHGKLEAGRIMGDSIVDILLRVHLIH